jgi:hypothetical protein
LGLPGEFSLTHTGLGAATGGSVIWLKAVLMRSRQRQRDDRWRPNVTYVAHQSQQSSIFGPANYIHRADFATCAIYSAFRRPVQDTMDYDSSFT